MGIEVVCGSAGSKIETYWVVGAPVDFRCGAERLLVQVREMLGRSPLDGSVMTHRFLHRSHC